MPAPPSGSRFRPRGGGFLSRGGWFYFTLSLRPMTGTGCPSAWNLAVLGPSHNERDVVNDLQPLGVVVGGVVEVSSGRSGFGVGRTCLPLLQVPSVCTTPPSEAQDQYKSALGTAGEDIRPLIRALR